MASARRRYNACLWLGPAKGPVFHVMRLLQVPVPFCKKKRQVPGASNKYALPAVNCARTPNERALQSLLAGIFLYVSVIRLA